MSDLLTCPDYQVGNLSRLSSREPVPTIESGTCPDLPGNKVNE